MQSTSQLIDDILRTSHSSIPLQNSESMEPIRGPTMSFTTPTNNYLTFKKTNKLSIFMQHFHFFIQLIPKRFSHYRKLLKRLDYYYDEHHEPGSEIIKWTQILKMQ